MNAKEILDKIASSPERRTDVPTPPPVELVAFIVRWARSLRHWKVSTLADFARVSVSTVERVERAEKVSNVCDVHAPSVFQLQRSEVDLRAVK